jgi:hypothetical protein
MSNMSVIEAMDLIFKSRYERTALDATKHYEKLHRDADGTFVRTYVGRFVRTYQSDDGSGVHWEFMKDGHIITEEDSIWGSVKDLEQAILMEVVAPLK